ncbi:ABC transporter ATP-binding protein [Aureimonas fodinaquatilis]|uniref:ABC transporter ATP-binding protein n=1 Tax=Aureimonas fodinaquatilis TaxID=2565783 RepID=A0A5B0E2G4_9HYPH|nr:ABC transporter ATP-binding protein [Aureimonas fodinaquatilis]KAA0972151.1 ABC transporter ATP-binding protein [Aureimonas fodinaquatilis]
MLEGRNLTVTYDGFKALDGVSVQLKPGMVTGLIGPNGAGKSTLFSVLAGSVIPTTGQVYFNDEDITSRPPVIRARLGLGRSFQLSRDLAGLTVVENLLVAQPERQFEGIGAALFRRNAIRHRQEIMIEKARELLSRVDLWRLADQPSAALSGGQKKLLDLCRVLMLEPRFILLDEPSAGVNPTRIAEITEFIRSLVAEGISFGMVEHNMGMVAALCDQVYALAEGRLVAHGTFEEVTANDDVARAYLGVGA